MSSRHSDGCSTATPTRTLAQLLDVDVDRSPFALAARATAHAILGDREQALADVRAVESMDSVSYWDLAVAQVAAAVAAVGDEAEHRRDDLVATVARLEDVVVTSYAADVLARLGRGSEVRADRPPPFGGWATVSASLVPAG